MTAGSPGRAGPPDTVRPSDASALGDAWPRENCSVLRAVELLGKRSTLLLLREAFLGTRRFDDFARRVGVTESVAAARLRELVASGLLERHPYRDPGQRTRHEYRLTAKGRDLLPVILALLTWGDTYLADASGPPLVVTHEGCGEPVRAEARCAAGHLVRAGETRAHAGPGAHREPEPAAR
jgi:DNA-binding HxlR family transcriptional regulator